MQKNNSGLGIQATLKAQPNTSLQVFTAKMAEFDRKFCDAVASKNEFTIRLEIKGDKGKVVHCRVYNDTIERPEKL